MSLISPDALLQADLMEQYNAKDRRCVWETMREQAELEEQRSSSEDTEDALSLALRSEMNE